MKNKAVIESLDLVKFGRKGWYSSDNVECPDCGKSGKFGIHSEYTVCHCFKCGYKSSLRQYLTKIRRFDLISNEITIDDSDKIISKLISDQIEEKEEECRIPLFYKPLNSHPYLTQRNFNSNHVEFFKPGTAELNPIIGKNYIVFLIYMKGELRGWVARSLFSKDWHKDNLEKAKIEGIRPKLRWINSNNSFNKLLGGYDEINNRTEIVIGVEGLTDKVNIDNLLNLHKNDLIKCVFTFGNSISIEQIHLLQAKNIERFILMYDNKTIKESRDAIKMCSTYMNTDVATIPFEGKDPGDLTDQELSYIFSKCIKSANIFLTEYINNKIEWK